MKANLCYDSAASRVIYSEEAEVVVTMDYDLSLVERVRRGDNAAFAVIFEEYNLQICRYLCRLVGDNALAEDLAQDTFVKAYKALPASSPTNLKAWLYTIATNAAMSALRRRKLIAWLPFPSGSDGAPEPAEEDWTAGMGDRDLIERALANLPKYDVACLLLHFRQGLGYPELAQVLGVSVPAAKMRLSRVRSAFREVYLRLSQETQA
jgi:RNA polymerase sigma-70 factor (ECF subfamily)